jgi:Asp-tRNA(Asn)/Glu-tRNA(Gln) amidotransferase A subunit family amidase
MVAGAAGRPPRKLKIALIRSDHCDLLEALGKKPNADDVEAVTWAVYQRGLRVDDAEYVEPIAAVHAAGRRMGAFLTGYDVILRLFRPEWGYRRLLSAASANILSVMPLHRAAGTPAMSVPLSCASGLPIGVHFARPSCGLPPNRRRHVRGLTACRPFEATR